MRQAAMALLVVTVFFLLARLASIALSADQAELAWPAPIEREITFDGVRY
jgi:hypothetical protein